MHERRVGQQQADVVRIEPLAAFGTADGHAALADLQAQVVAEAVPARAVRAAEEARGPLGRQAHQAQRALHLLGAAALGRLVLLRPHRRGLRLSLDSGLGGQSLHRRGLGLDRSRGGRRRRGRGRRLGLRFGPGAATAGRGGEDAVEGEAPAPAAAAALRVGGGRMERGGARRLGVFLGAHGPQKLRGQGRPAPPQLPPQRSPPASAPAAAAASAALPETEADQPLRSGYKASAPRAAAHCAGAGLRHLTTRAAPREALGGTGRARAAGCGEAPPPAVRWSGAAILHRLHPPFLGPCTVLLPAREPSVHL